MFLMFFLYLSVFFTLGIFVSARTSKSSTSFLVLLFIWVIFVTVIPKVSVMAASQIKPIPSVHEITAKKDAFLQQIQGERPEEVQDWMKANAQKPGDDPKVFQEKFKKYMEDFQQELTGKIDANNAALERDYQIRKRAQESLAVNLSRISPASALMFSTMSLARTGLDENDRFLASIRAYKPIFTKWANPEDDAGHQFRHGRDRRARSSWTTCPSTRSSPKPWANRSPGRCPTSWS